MKRTEKQKRTIDQNRLMWPLLEDLSLQTDWHGEKLAPTDWKIMFMAALSREGNMERWIVPGINGGFVDLGRHSSDLEVGPFSDLIELIYSFGAERGVKFRTDRRPPVEAYEMERA